MAREELSANALISDGSIKCLLLGRGERAHRPFRQVAERDRSNGHSDQSQNVTSQTLKHAADVAVLAFVEHNFKPASAFNSTQKTSSLGSQAAHARLHAPGECSNQFLVRR
jgi:hypothetical protein